MSKPVVVRFHISPSGKSWWVDQGKAKLPFPIACIPGKAPLGKNGLVLKVPKHLRKYGVCWFTPTKRVFYSPNPKKLQWKDNCGGGGIP